MIYSQLLHQQTIEAAALAYIRIESDDDYLPEHAGRRIKVEWGIGGLKMKWRILNGVFRARRVKYAVIMKACCILTNLLHRRRMDLNMEDLGNARGGAWKDEESDNDY